MKKLKLYLEQIENTVVMRVLEQEGIEKDLSENVKVHYGPDLQDESISIRGKILKTDHRTYCLILDTQQHAEEYLQKVISWLDEVFVKKVEPKRGDYVEVWDNNTCEYKRIFLAKIEGSEYPYVCVHGEDEKKYLNGIPFDYSVYKYMQPLTKSGYNPDTKIYEGELS